ncbi:MAG TPA: SDR family oxidoreductase [Anaerolineales bacterium]|nr:SDR family oxidoreductase [Anaerolineales bacterium]
MKILVTGAGGLLGLNLSLDLAKSHQIAATDRKRLDLPDGIQSISADLLADNALPALLDEAEPDAVIHCAALANVDACESDPAFSHQMNAELPGQLAAECARRGVKLVHISTDAVFDGQTGGYTEDDPTHPLSVYAQTKLDGERLVFEAYPEAVVTRVNLFGWSASGNRSLGEMFYYGLEAGKPLKGFTDVTFCPILVNDLASVFSEILAKNLSGLYHLVSPVGMTKHAFGDAIAEKFGFDPARIEPVKVADFGLKAARSLNLTLDVSRLTAALGRPLPDVHGGLERFYELHQSGYPPKLKEMVDQV